MSTDLALRARTFRELNERGGLLLPNAWDAASARVFESAGFPAVGTTSAGIAYTRGFRDGQRTGRQMMIDEIANIARALSVPVSADIEAGYGDSPADVTETVLAAVDAGAVGINLEDNTQGGAKPLYAIAAQQERVAAARAAGSRRDIHVTINARTDPFLLGLGAGEEERVQMTLERGRAYIEAGADLVFVPLLVAPDPVRRLSEAFGGRLSLMILPGAPSASTLFAAGARRLSLGQTAMLASLGTVQAVARELLETGTWSAIEKTFFGFGEAEKLFS